MTEKETEGQELSDPFKVSDQPQVGLMGLDSERPEEVVPGAPPRAWASGHHTESQRGGKQEWRESPESGNFSALYLLACLWEWGAHFLTGSTCHPRTALTGKAPFDLYPSSTSALRILKYHLLPWSYDSPTNTWQQKPGPVNCPTSGFSQAVIIATHPCARPGLRA